MTWSVAELYFRWGDPGESWWGEGCGALGQDLADENLAVGKDIPDLRASEGRDRGYGRHGMIKGESSRRGARSQGQVQVSEAQAENLGLAPRAMKSQWEF